MLSPAGHLEELPGPCVSTRNPALYETSTFKDVGALCCAFAQDTGNRETMKQGEMGQWEVHNRTFLTFLQGMRA